MKQECPQPLEGALAVSILAVFFCPASDYRKRHPQPRRWHTKATGDTDNIAKAVLDAGNSTLWLDDRQVAVLHVAKMIAAQGEPPFVEIEVRQLEEEPK
jgi:Holliday junction resolvase RusA-like endonuclease